MNTEENEQCIYTEMETEQFVYMSYMLNRLKKKAKKKLAAEQFAIYKETLEQFNEGLKRVDKDLPTVPADITEKQLHFLLFFSQSTAQQTPDPGQKKVLQDLHRYFEEIKKGVQLLDPVQEDTVLQETI